MKKTYVFIFNLYILFVFSLPVFSQTEKTYALRLGIDISRFSLLLLNPDRKALEFSADVELKKNYIPTIEIGFNNIHLKKDSLYNYTSNGNYYRLGVDYNLLKPKTIHDKELFFLGCRYGMSFFNHTVNDILIKDSYWGNYNGTISPKSSLAQWIELTGGIRAEVIKNFYFGWSLRARILLHKTKEAQNTIYWIPGYGKGNVKSAIGFNYSIFYSIPVFKTKIK